jgi:F0F1-type ATP synthase assembly protein I
MFNLLEIIFANLLLHILTFSIIEDVDFLPFFVDFVPRLKIDFIILVKKLNRTSSPLKILLLFH